MKRKIAIFSDIHGNLQALNAILEDNTISIEKVNLKYNRKEFEKVFNNTNYPDKDKIGQIFFGINN